MLLDKVDNAFYLKLGLHELHLLHLPRAAAAHLARQSVHMRGHVAQLLGAGRWRGSLWQRLLIEHLPASRGTTC